MPRAHARRRHDGHGGVMIRHIFAARLRARRCRAAYFARAGRHASRAWATADRELIHFGAARSIIGHFYFFRRAGSTRQLRCRHARRPKCDATAPAAPRYSPSAAWHRVLEMPARNTICCRVKWPTRRAGARRSGRNNSRREAMAYFDAAGPIILGHASVPISAMPPR